MEKTTIFKLMNKLKNNNKIRENIIFLIFIFYVQYFHSQQNFSVETSYIIAPNDNFVEENFAFNFDKNNNIISVIDKDLKLTNTYPVRLLKTKYVDNGKFFVIHFVGDLEIEDPEKIFNSERHSFQFYYDKKMGNILFIVETNFNVRAQKQIDKEEVYFTDYGKKFLQEN
mgnify:CR=1 FL=1